MPDPEDHRSDGKPRQNRGPNDLTPAEVARIVGASKNPDDAKLRLGLGPVTDKHLHTYLVSKGFGEGQPKDTIQKRIDDASGLHRDPWAPNKGPEVRAAGPDEKIVGRIISRPSPDGMGFVKTYERGTAADLEKRQEAANYQANQQVMDGLLQGLAGMQKGSASRPPPEAERLRSQPVERAYNKPTSPEARPTTAAPAGAPKVEAKPEPRAAVPRVEPNTAPRTEPTTKTDVKAPGSNAEPTRPVANEAKTPSKAEATKPAANEAKTPAKTEATKPAANDGKPGEKVEPTKPGAKDGSAGGKPEPSQRLIPDHEIVTRRITAGSGSDRGVTSADRQWAKDVAARHGETGKIDVAHASNPHVFTKPGESVLVRPQNRSVNRAEGRPIAQSAEARRALNATQPPENQLTVRDKHAPAGSAKSVDRAYSSASPKAEQPAAKPKTETPKVDKPKTETPKVDKPKTETPKVERPPPDKPPGHPVNRRP